MNSFSMSPLLEANQAAEPQAILYRRQHILDDLRRGVPLPEFKSVARRPLYRAVSLAYTSPLAALLAVPFANARA
jgi:hypothetical protein